MLLVAAFFLPRSSLAQCTWGGTPSVLPPSSVPLRSYRDSLHAPGPIAIDDAGTLYITDPGTGRVFVKDPLGRSIGLLEGFATPLGIAIDRAGRFYVGEQGRGSVTVYDQGWNPLFVLGRGDGEFLMPNDIRVDPATDRIYVVDSAAHAVKIYLADGSLLSVFGGKGSGPGQFDFPAGIHVSPLGELFVTDQNNDRVQVFDLNGSFLRCFGKSGWFSFSRKFGRLQGITGDALGRLYLADTFQGYVQVFDRWGVALAEIGSFGEARGQLRTPVSVAIDPYNRLLVSSANNARVELFGLDSFSDPHIVTAVVDIDPNMLKRDRGGQFITAYIQAPGYRPENVVLASVTASGVPGDVSSAAIVDHDGDGVAELMMKFDAAAVLATLADIPDGDAAIVVAGVLSDGSGFEGYDMVRLKTGGGK